MEQKIALNPFGGTLGETGVREKSVLRARVQWACATRLFLLNLRGMCTVFFPVFAMFAMTTMAHSVTLTPVSQVTPEECSSKI